MDEKSHAAMIDEMFNAVLAGGAKDRATNKYVEILFSVWQNERRLTKKQYLTLQKLYMKYEGY